MTPCEIALNLNPPPIDLPDIVATFDRGLKEGASQERHRVEFCLFSVRVNVLLSGIAVGEVESKCGIELSKLVVDVGG